MSHDCNTGKLRSERLFMPAHHLMLTFTEEGRKTFELWLQHQIIFSTYTKITLRVTVNALYEQGMLLTPGSQMSDVKCPWNILRGAVSSKVLTIWFTSQQVFADILLIPGLKFKELFLGRSFPSIPRGPLPSLLPLTCRERWTRRQLMTTSKHRKVSGGRGISKMFLFFWFCCSLLRHGDCDLLRFGDWVLNFMFSYSKLS